MTAGWVVAAFGLGLMMTALLWWGLRQQVRSAQDHADYWHEQWDALNVALAEARLEQVRSLHRQAEQLADLGRSLAD